MCKVVGSDESVPGLFSDSHTSSGEYDRAIDHVSSEGRR